MIKKVTKKRKWNDISVIDITIKIKEGRVQSQRFTKGKR